MQSDRELEERTRSLAAAGYRLLQGLWLAPDERGHVATLLGRAAIPFGGRVLDVGCGTGRMAEVAAQIRPDVQWVLSNKSPSQLAMCDARAPRICCDGGRLPFPAESFDAVLWCWSLGHMGEDALTEGARVVRRGGHGLVYDVTGLSLDIGYARRSSAEIRAMAGGCGWSVAMEWADPGINRSPFPEVFGKCGTVTFRLLR